MSKTIITKCRNIREQLRVCTKKRLRREIAIAEETKTWEIRTANNVVINLYRELQKTIYDGCGHNFYEPVFISDNCLPDPEVHQLILDNFGLNLITVNDTNLAHYVRIDSYTDLKPLTVTVWQNDIPHHTAQINFLKLYQEDCARYRLWQSHLDLIAKDVIDYCRKCLAEMPNKFYGLPVETAIVDAKGFNAFYKKQFTIADLRIAYSALTTTQLQELRQHINKLISHGRVRISCSDFYKESIWVYINKAPEKVIENSYFDYSKVYAQYETITPELQKHFDYISSHLELPSVESQYLSLSPDQKLIYWFSEDEGPNWGIMQKRFTDPSNQVLLQSLSEYLSSAHPGINVLDISFKCHEECHWSPRGCGGRHSYQTERHLEITYKILNPGCDIAKNILRLQADIERIKTSKHHRAARELTKHIIASIEQNLSERNGEFLISPPNSTTALQDADFVVNIDDHLVDLSKVKDPDFLARVSQAVYDISNKLISIDLNATGTIHFILNP